MSPVLKTSSTYPTVASLLALALVIFPLAALTACPFCTMQGQTLTGDVNAAGLVFTFIAMRLV